MSNLIIIFTDQLSENISALDNLNIKNDVILLCEAKEEFSFVKHHKKKLLFMISSMRNFANELLEKNLPVKYFTLQEGFNKVDDCLEKITREQNFNKIIITKPSDWRLWQKVINWQDKYKNIEVRENNHFLSNEQFFADWAHNKKELRMEYFYREMRKKYNILMEENKPIGGKWNYDSENRKFPSSILVCKDRPKNNNNQKIIEEVQSLIMQEFGDHFGDIAPFDYAISRKDALIQLNFFIDNLLANFGDYQDAMLEKQPHLYHSMLSCYINIGLINPIEVCLAAEKAYYLGKAPLNSVEGFIRQILGWREYIKGIYWRYMPKYASLNYLETKLKLPDYYWGANTKLNCIKNAVDNTKKYAYAHHIQRLMITGNFALIAGIDVKEVQEWYLIVYADAFEWVEMPNTLGMALFGDGGIVASKPYAASGKYINKMSDYCKSCYYNPEETIGEKACPFNSLYWNFTYRHKEKLYKNQRMKYVFATWDKFSSEKKEAIKDRADFLLKHLNEL